MPKISILEAEIYPIKLSMRLSILKTFGGPLKNQYDSWRLDHLCCKCHHSRYAGKTTKKDFRINGTKNYKPWQYQ